MLNIFFAPRVKSDYFIEQMLIDACVHDCSHRIGENIVENYSHKFYFSRLSTYKNIIKAVTAYVISITNIQSLVHYELDGVNIGRPAYAAALLNYKVYDNGFIIYFELLKRILTGVRALSLGFDIVEQSKKYNSVSVYLRDIAYIDAVLFDLFMKNSIGVYTSASPHGLMYCNDRSLTSIKIRKYPYPKISITDEEYGRFMMGRIGNPHDYIVYYSPDSNSSEKKDLTDVSCDDDELIVLLYVHSFTDAQLYNGYDGFINLYDWLVFTIDRLIDQKVRVIIKGHPNFWAVGYLAGVIEWDKLVWRKVLNKYKDVELLHFIDEPVDNGIILSTLNSDNAIIISHHSSAVAEAAYLGFKTLTSYCSPWGHDYYDFSNTWKTKDEYEILLKSINKLNAPNKEPLKNFIADRFYYDRDCKDGSPWWVVMSDEAGIGVTDLVKKPTTITKDIFSDYLSSVQRLSSSIRHI